MRTVSAKPLEVKHAWHVVDAAGVPVGRLASRIARVIMGKHRTDWTPHVDCGDFVIVVNCDKVKITGRKSETKRYYKYSDYPGGLKVRSWEQLQESKPGETVRLAVRRMLPKTRLGRTMIRKLKTFAGAEHNHVAQQPQPLILS
jgi:large subunit ribosomal protein L13